MYVYYSFIILTATEELNYPVCVVLNDDLALKAAINENMPGYNSATRCASHCKGLQYMFSGTKVSYLVNSHLSFYWEMLVISFRI